MNKLTKDFNLGIMTQEQVEILTKKIQGKTWRNIEVNAGIVPGGEREVTVTLEYYENEDVLEVAEFLMYVMATT